MRAVVYDGQLRFTTDHALPDVPSGWASGVCSGDDQDKPQRALARFAGGFLLVLWSLTLSVVLLAPFAFPGGRRFQFLDPSGNELAVWSER